MTPIELEQRLDWACKQLYALKQRIEDLERQRQTYAVADSRQMYTTREPTGETVA